MHFIYIIQIYYFDRLFGINKIKKYRISQCFFCTAEEIPYWAGILCVVEKMCVMKLICGYGRHLRFLNLMQCHWWLHLAINHQALIRTYDSKFSFLKKGLNYQYFHDPTTLFSVWTEIMIIIYHKTKTLIVQFYSIPLWLCPKCKKKKSKKCVLNVYKSS